MLAVMCWTAEALNTAVEFLTDLASPTYYRLAGQAKDIAAGAVLVAATGGDHRTPRAQSARLAMVALPRVIQRSRTLLQNRSASRAHAERGCGAAHAVNAPLDEVHY